MIRTSLPGKKRPRLVFFGFFSAQGWWVEATQGADPPTHTRSMTCCQHQGKKTQCSVTVNVHSLISHSRSRTRVSDADCQYCQADGAACRCVKQISRTASPVQLTTISILLLVQRLPVEKSTPSWRAGGGSCWDGPST